MGGARRLEIVAAGKRPCYRLFRLDVAVVECMRTDVQVTMLTLDRTHRRGMRYFLISGVDYSSRTFTFSRFRRLLQESRPSC